MRKINVRSIEFSLFGWDVLSFNANKNCVLFSYQIYDGTSSSAPKIAEVTSSKHPPTIVSEGNALTIALDDIAEKDFAFTFDFEATYSTIDSGKYPYETDKYFEKNVHSLFFIGW